MCEHEADSYFDDNDNDSHHSYDGIQLFQLISPNKRPCVLIFAVETVLLFPVAPVIFHLLNVRKKMTLLAFKTSYGAEAESFSTALKPMKTNTTGRMINKKSIPTSLGSLQL